MDNHFFKKSQLLPRQPGYTQYCAVCGKGQYDPIHRVTETGRWPNVVQGDKDRCWGCGFSKEPTRPNSHLCRSCEAARRAERVRRKVWELPGFYSFDFDELERRILAQELSTMKCECGHEYQCHQFSSGGCATAFCPCAKFIPAVVPKPPTQYVAVVFKNDTQASQRTAFSGNDKDAVIQKAIEERKRWTSKNQGPFRILVGELTEEVVTPEQYTLKPL